MKTFKIIIVSFVLMTQWSWANQKTNDRIYLEISQEQAIKIASQHVIKGVQSKALDAAWQESHTRTATLQNNQGKQLWKVTFEQGKGDQTKTMDVFVNTMGEVHAISH